MTWMAGLGVAFIYLLWCPLFRYPVAQLMALYVARQPRNNVYLSSNCLRMHAHAWWCWLVGMERV
jgi:hypothetical protein